MDNLAKGVMDTIRAVAPDEILATAVNNREQWEIVCRRACVNPGCKAANEARDELRKILAG